MGIIFIVLMGTTTWIWHLGGSPRGGQSACRDKGRLCVQRDDHFPDGTPITFGARDVTLMKFQLTNASTTDLDVRSAFFSITPSSTASSSLSHLRLYLGATLIAPAFNQPLPPPSQQPFTPPANGICVLRSPYASLRFNMFSPDLDYWTYDLYPRGGYAKVNKQNLSLVDIASLQRACKTDFDILLTKYCTLNPAPEDNTQILKEVATYDTNGNLLSNGSGCNPSDSQCNINVRCSVNPPRPDPQIPFFFSVAIPAKASLEFRLIGDIIASSTSPCLTEASSSPPRWPDTGVTPPPPRVYARCLRTIATTTTFQIKLNHMDAFFPSDPKKLWLFDIFREINDNVLTWRNFEPSAWFTVHR